jgi:16S rRNA G527 N7-methylase RsmG
MIDSLQNKILKYVDRSTGWNKKVNLNGVRNLPENV